MKILILGEASNYFATLAPALEAMGHQVTLASHGNFWMQTQRHIDISRSENRLSGARLYWRMRTEDALRGGYDTVILCDTSFVHLRPQRQLEIFKSLKKRNGKVILTALSSNALYVRNLTGPDPALPYSEWQTPWGEANKHVWLTKENLDYASYLYENVDGIASALYEYHTVCRALLPEQNIVYTGIPVNSCATTPRQSESIRMLLAVYPGREAEKGLDILMPLVYRLMHDSDRPIELKYVSGVPFQEFKRILSQSDIVIDQLYAMSPATTALMAMRSGIIPITGGHPDWLKFIGAESAPLIATDPRDPDATYRAMLHALPQIDRLRQQAPAFAGSNSPEAVASRFSTLL